MTTTKKRHWLLGVLEGVPVDLEALEARIPSNTPVTDAWSRVCEATRLSEKQLAARVAEQYGLEVADMSTLETGALKLVPASMAHRSLVVPIRVGHRDLTVATADPTDVDTEQDLISVAGRFPVFSIAPPRLIEEALLAHYSPDRAVETLLESVTVDAADSVRVVEEETPDDVAQADLEAGPVVKLSNLILKDAVDQRATDIHLQPASGGGTVRFRIDGVLRPYMNMPRAALNRVISRIKILGKMDISDRLRPQDGRARIAIGPHVFDLRISSVPTRRAEKAVIRILDPETSSDMASLGITPYELQAVRQLFTFRNGIVPVTGPTGSGKTTTLYGALRELATSEVNIMTVEDPVEYEFSGLTQIQVEPKRGVTFSNALRAILRQDPDIILVGEIRDRETAEIAVQASLTGHLVLTTLHTNDAVGAIRRLKDLGLDSTSICETLRGAVAQRLARRACMLCMEQIEGKLTDEEKRLAERFEAQPVVRAVGCETCANTGYLGRVPILEVFIMTPEIEQAIREDRVPSELRTLAENAGLRPLLSSGLELVGRGETTLEEIDRVLGDKVRSTSKSVHSASGGLFPDEPAEVTEARDGVLPRRSVGRILVVDDDVIARRIAWAALEREGYEVSECADGQEVLDRLTMDPDYSAIVLDLKLPGVSGLDLLAHIRSTKTTMGIQVIVLTANTDSDTEVEVMEAGADDFLPKPIHPERFVARVRAAIRRARG